MPNICHFGQSLVSGLLPEVTDMDGVPGAVWISLDTYNYYRDICPPYDGYTSRKDVRGFYNILTTTEEEGVGKSDCSGFWLRPLRIAIRSIRVHTIP